MASTGLITTKNLYSYVVKEIEKRVQFPSTSNPMQHLSRELIAPLGLSGSGALAEIRLSDLIGAIQELLKATIPATIISGLEVTETVPPSSSVNVAAGTGSVGGRLFEIASVTTVSIPFNLDTEVYYLNLFLDRIMVEAAPHPDKLSIAKIIIPEVGATGIVRDTQQDPTDAYIVMLKEIKFFGSNGQLEEDSLEILRDNIAPILASTIIGTITLSENLRVINSAGTLLLDSQSLKIKDDEDRVLSEFNKRGAFFFDETGAEIAKFSTTEARIGNIRILTDSLQSGNFLAGSSGFQIKANGDVEFNGLTIRGTIFATGGEIGGFTITETELYGGIIKTAETVEAGATGVIMDTDGLRGYDAVLGETFNLPTDGSPPSFSSGIISETIFEINTNAVIRTSATVGDGTANSAGILINSTGLYGVEANQLLANANLKALIDGTIRLRGEILAESGQIGGTTITATTLSGGLIVGSTIRGAVIETSDTAPRIRMDTSGLFFQQTTAVGKYGGTGSGDLGFQYGDGSKYGAGLSAILFQDGFPILTVLAEQTDSADIRLFDRSNDPVSGDGPHVLGDLICVSSVYKICKSDGSPGTFESLVSSDGTTSGSGQASGGAQTVKINVDGTTYDIYYN